MALKKLQLEIGVASTPFKGESVSGDRAIIHRWEQKVLIAVIDIAGHGARADKLAQSVKSMIDDNYRQTPAKLALAIHETFRGSRGLVGSLSLIDLVTRSMSFVAVGNVYGLLLNKGQTKKRFINHSGIIGYVIPTLSETQLDLSEEDELIIYTDGIQEHFQLDKIETRKNINSQIKSEAILKEFKRETDDALCVVAKVIS